MLVLLDTSVLIRLSDSADPGYPIAIRALITLQSRGHEFRICPQVIAEFHNVATRSRPQNGLGLSIAQTIALRSAFETEYAVIHDSIKSYVVWKQIVDSINVTGKTVHDARLVAMCGVNYISAILTFNISHFTTLCQGVPGLRVIDPATV